MGKNPESHNHPPPFDPFQPESQPCSLFSHPKPRTSFNQNRSPMRNEAKKPLLPKSTHSTAFTTPKNYFSPFSAQKSHVKPPNALSFSNATRYAWHVSPLNPLYWIYRSEKHPRCPGKLLG